MRPASPTTAHAYTTDGRKLNGKPVRRGFYIMGGKKIYIN